MPDATFLVNAHLLEEWHSELEPALNRELLIAGAEMRPANAQTDSMAIPLASLIGMMDN
jgi:hypothetical protein